MHSLKKDQEEFIKNNKLIFKKQQGLTRYNVFTEETDKIALSSNDDKRMQSIDLIETYVYGTSKHLGSHKEKIKCSNTIK